MSSNTALRSRVRGYTAKLWPQRQRSAVLLITAAALVAGLTSAVPTLAKPEAAKLPTPHFLKPMAAGKSESEPAPKPTPSPKNASPKAKTILGHAEQPPSVSETVKPGEEMKDRRTANSKTFATDDPTKIRMQVFENPIHFRNGNGHWQTIDDDLAVEQSGVAKPRSDQTDMTFASDASSSALGAINLGSNRSVSFGLSGASPSKRSIAANKATYADAAPSADIELEAHPDALKETIVLKSAEAPNSYTFDLRVRGVTPHVVNDGREVELRDAKGELAATIPPGYLADSSVSEIGEPATSNNVLYSVAQTKSGWSLTISADAGWLNDPARVFPVRLDPSVTLPPIYQTAEDIDLQSNITNNSNPTSQDLRVGYCNVSLSTQCGANFTAYSLLRFPFSNIAGHNITTASLNLRQTWSYNCLSRATNIQEISADWTAAPTLNYPGPSVRATPVVQAYSAAGNTCADAWVPFDIKPFLNDWKTLPNYGMRLWSPDTTDMTGWKRFASKNNTQTWAVPYVSLVLDNSAPNTPTSLSPADGAWITSGMPQLSATYSDPEGDVGSVSFSVINVDTNTIVASTTVNNVASGQPATWTPPQLADGTYSWSARAFDGYTYSSWTALRSFGIGQSPTFTITTPVGKTSGGTRGDTAWFHLEWWNKSATSWTIQGISEDFGASMSAVGTTITYGGDGLTTGPCTSPTCSLANNVLNVGAMTLGAGTKRFIDIEAVIVGSSPICSVASHVATLTSLRITMVRPLYAVACETALGREPWFTFTKTDIGPQSFAGVNVANGNLVIQQADTTPVQGNGRLALGTVRTYNSQAYYPFTGPGGLGLELPGTFGAGWTLNVATAGDLQGVTAPAGLLVPADQTVDAPLSITMIDQDGTRHVFKNKLLSSPLIAVPTLAPIALNSFGLTTCVDQTYQPPAGVHVSLFRYVAIPVGATCPNKASWIQNGQNAAVVMGFEAITPDRLRSEFGPKGQLVAFRDANGNVLQYVYDSPLSGRIFGRLRRVYEPASNCSDGTQAFCRVLKFNYIDTSPYRVDVTDAAGRVTKYNFDKVFGSIDAHLTSVTNPDATASHVDYTYGGCNGGIHQLCSVSDPRNHYTRFTYDGTQPYGPSRVATMGTRRTDSYATDGFTQTAPNEDLTSFAYTSATQTDVTRVGTLRSYQNIDSSGRVGTLSEGSSPSDIQRSTTFTWDTAGVPCNQPDHFVDNNLCQVTRNAIASPETTTRKYTAEGLPLIETRMPGAPAANLVTTWGYKTQVIRTTGVDVYTDTVAGGGNVTSTTGASGSRTETDPTTLFVISDQTQKLSPRGNKSGNEAVIGAYTTTYNRDNNYAIPAGNAPAGKTCGTGTGFVSANTGNLCELITPGSDSGLRHTLFRYDQYGRKFEMVSPKAYAAGTPVTTYDYYGPTDTDLSTTRTANGWLKGVTDPEYQFVVFAYDAAGNVARSWDRNATTSLAPTTRTAAQHYDLAGAAGWNTLSPPSTQFTETLYGTGSGTALFANPWRYVRSREDPLHEKTTYPDMDANGNVLTLRPPRGNPYQGASVATYDVTALYDAADHLVFRQTPSERVPTPPNPVTSWQYWYDTRDNLVAIKDPDAATAWNPFNGDSSGHVTAIHYDAVNRPDAKTWTRGSTTDIPTVPAACHLSTGPTANTNPNDKYIVNGRVACNTSVTYDRADRVASELDPDHQQISYFYDGAGRQLRRERLRSDTPTVVNLRIVTNYDEDGDVTDICSPRQFSTEPGASGTAATTCGSSDPYGWHATYHESDDVKTTATFDDPAGAAMATRYKYDVDGNLTDITDGRGFSLSNPNVTDAKFTTTNTYTMLDRLDTKTVPRDTSTNPPSTKTTTYHYDPVGNLKAVLSPDNTKITAYSYDFVNRLLDTVVGSDNEEAGKSTSFVAPTAFANTRTRLVYDADGHVVARYAPNAFKTPNGDWLDPDERFMTRTDYDNDGRPSTSWTPRFDATSASDLGLDTTQTTECPTTGIAPPPVPVKDYPAGVGVCRSSVAYDAADRVNHENLATQTGGSGRYVDFTLTDDGLVRVVNTPSPSGTGRVDAVKRVFDASGRTLSEVDGTITDSSYTYTKDGLLLSQTLTPATNPRTTTNAFNLNGQVISISDPGANLGPDISSKEYWASGRVKSSIDGEGGKTSYVYDAPGNVTSVLSPAGNAGVEPNLSRTATTYSYFGDNLVKTITQPIDETKSVPYIATQARVTTFDYDGAGRQIDRWDVTQPLPSGTPVDGQHQSQSWGNNDRLHVETGRFDQGVSDETNNPNLPNATITNDYDPSGNLTSTTDSGSTIGTTSTYFLDNLPRQVTSTRVVGYSYNGSGQRSALSNDIFGTTKYTINDAGFTSTIDSPASGGVTGLGYDVAGRQTSQTSPNGVGITMVPNTDGTLGSQTMAKSGTTLANWSYQYFPNQSIQSQTMTGVKAPGAGSVVQNTMSYTYDHAGRLSGVTLPGAQSATPIVFDKDGNRTGYGTTSSWEYRPDGSIRREKLTGQADYHSFGDPKPFGGVSNDGCSTYTYDGFDRLQHATSGCGSSDAVYSYDGLNRQRTSTVGASTKALSYDGLGTRITVENDAGGTPNPVDYALAPSGTPLSVRIGTTVQQLADDGNHNIATATDSTGAVACTVRYEPFGDAIAKLSATNPCSSGSTSSTAFFNAARRDADRGTYQMGSRTYDPIKGSFLTPDAYRGGGSDASVSVGVDPLTRNTYAYVNGDPVNWMDPDGHAAVKNNCQRYTPDYDPSFGRGDYHGQIENPDAPGGAQNCAGSDENVGTAKPAPVDPQKHHSWWQRTKSALGSLIPFRGCFDALQVRNYDPNQGGPDENLSASISCALDVTLLVGSFAAKPIALTADLGIDEFEHSLSSTVARSTTDDVVDTAFVQSSKSESALRANLEANGEFATGDYQAHHIVLGASSNPLDVEAREVLTAHRIDINAAENGVYAPGPGWHQTLHNNAYRQGLLEDLQAAAGDRNDVLEVLRTWKQRLVDDQGFNPRTGNRGDW